jgi:hypothetical protein
VFFEEVPEWGDIKDLAISELRFQCLLRLRVYSVDFDVSHMVLLARIYFKEHIDCRFFTSMFIFGQGTMSINPHPAV